ncbi:Aldehyde dehydrogenase [Termitomyces sp. J132]|nr:Aldehyde dehydrogenase [Termitomyces sp. J132]
MLVGRKILKACSESNSKVVTLELGEKDPSCAAGSRIFVQKGIYDKFLGRFTAIENNLAATTGDPFVIGMQHGPQTSQVEFDRVMSYIELGKREGATVHIGGSRHSQKGYFKQPTIFTNVKPEMKIVKEEIFGRDRGRVYDERCICRGHVNYAKTVDKAVPFGDHKQSGIGRELGEYALDT